MTWIRKRLSECTEYITDGDHQPAPKANDGIRFIKIKDIIGNRISFDADMYVPREYYDALPAERKAQNGDVLYTVVGSYGTPCFVDLQERFCFERNIALLHPNETIDSKFLYYAMLNPSFFAAVDAIANGSAQKLIPLSKLKAMEISVPALDIQRRIADILSAYDDLIENNQKQIKLLEEAAQRLYREWFVELRFPGHESTPVVDGVPEGWERGLLADVADINTNSLARGYALDHIDYVDLSSVHCGQIQNRTRYTLQDAPGRAKRQAVHGDIIWGMVRPNLKSYALVLNPAESDVFSTGFAILSAQSVPYSYLYCTVTTEAFVGYLVNCTNGAAYPAVKPEHFAAARILIPEKSIAAHFDRLVRPMLEQVYFLQKQSEGLSEARDRLLPKLMSGDVEV